MKKAVCAGAGYVANPPPDANELALREIIRQELSGMYAFYGARLIDPLVNSLATQIYGFWRPADAGNWCRALQQTGI